MVFHSEHYHLELDKALHDKMSKIYIFQALMTFVKSSLGIFVPVYLYSIGYSISYVLFYTLIISISYLLFIPICVNLINKIGFKSIIFLSLPIYFLHILSLNYVDGNLLFFIIAPISFGLYMALFWPAMHSEISVNGSSKHRGSQMGTLQIITTIFATISPFVGGFILQMYGYSYLLAFATFFLILGALPLYFSNDIKLKHYNFKYSKYINFLKTKKYENSKLAFMGEGIEGLLALNLWPVVLFILLGSSFLNLGFLYGLTSIISILFLLYFKTYLDKHNKQKVLKVVSKCLSVNWYFRSLLVLFGSFFIYFVETFFRLINSIYILSFYSIFYNNAKNGVYMDYIIFRDLYLHLTKIIMTLAFIFILYLFGESFLILSLLIVVGIIVPIWISQFRED